MAKAKNALPSDIPVLEQLANAHVRIQDLERDLEAARARVAELEENEMLSASARLAQDGEMQRRRESHPIIQRAARFRNPEADRQALITFFARDFGHVFGVPSALVMGRFRRVMAECVNAVYPSICRSAARTVIEGHLAQDICFGPVPVHMREQLESALGMLDVLESMVHFYGVKSVEPAAEPEPACASTPT